MGTELVPETFYSNELTRLCAREDYIESCRRGSFKTYTTSNSHTTLCIITDNILKYWVFLGVVFFIDAFSAETAAHNSFIQLVKVWMYSKIPLIWLDWDWTHTKLNIPDYQMVPILVFTGNFLLLFLYLGCKTNQRNVPFGYLLYLLVQGHQGPLLCFLESS
jgi:hypothetical protein